MINKYVGANKKKRDEREKKKDGLQQFLGMLQGMQQKFINEWTEKHNQLAKLVDHVFKLATNEVGGLWANQQRVADSIDHIDINVLALAELNKKVYIQLYRRNSTDVGMTDEQLDTAALEAYKKDMAACFNTVLERRKKEDEAKKEAAEKAKADAKAAAEAKAEAERVEKVLMDAERPKTLAEAMDPINNKGGQGVDIPEGAQVFGG